MPLVLMQRALRDDPRYKDTAYLALSRAFASRCGLRNRDRVRRAATRVARADERGREGVADLCIRPVCNRAGPARVTPSMNATIDLQRRPSPAGRPNTLLFSHNLAWIGSWETDRVSALDPKTLSVREEFAAPGRPYGIAPVGADLRVVVGGFGEDDDRYFYRLTPASGFDSRSQTACPDLTGSHLAAKGDSLYLGQMHNRRILELALDGTIRRAIALPTRCAGFTFGPDGRFHMISADDEFENLQFGTLDIAQAAPGFEAIAPLPDEARGLAHDGTHWFTCLRDLNEIAHWTF